MNAFLNRMFFPRPDYWPHDEKLVSWGGGTYWTVGLSFEGSIHMGASGSGKTSGGVQLQTSAMMHAGYGVLFLTTTPADVEMCWRLARETGREKSVVKVGPGSGLGFNVLRYEMTAALSQAGEGDLAGNVATLFTSAAELAMPRREAGGSEHIWKQAVENLVRHAVTLAFRATGDLRLDDIVAIVKTAPQSLAQVKDPTWCRESICAQMLESARQRSAGDRNVALAATYFLAEFPLYPPDTRNSVLFSFSSGSADLFQREPLHSLFFAGTDYTPDILLEGAILLCDCPVNQYREIGRVATGLLRSCCQRMLDRRARHPSKRPVAIVWDESQKTLLRSDVSFQETARATLCATVASTQHVPAMKDGVGSDLALTFLGNLRTKLFFQNNEPETCDFMRRVCGQKEVQKTTKGHGSTGKQSSSETQTWEDALPAHATHNLKTGGEDNGYIVTGYVVVGSKPLRHQEPYQTIRIHQKKMCGWGFTKRARVVAVSRPCADFGYLRKGNA
jgi:hypothetical protein